MCAAPSRTHAALTVRIATSSHLTPVPVTGVDDVVGGGDRDGFWPVAEDRRSSARTPGDLGAKPPADVGQCPRRHRVEDDCHFFKAVLYAAMNPDASGAGDVLAYCIPRWNDP